MDNSKTEDTSNFLNWVEIKNFKSIKDLRLDCKRVNIFIGKPNVGKSNILEGLGMLGAGFTGQKAFDGIRYDQLDHLYYDNVLDKPIVVASDLQTVILVANSDIVNSTASTTKQYNLIFRHTDHYQAQDSDPFSEATESDSIFSINAAGDSMLPSSKRINFKDTWRVKKYDFINLTKFDNSTAAFLVPPYGSNLYAVIRRNKDLLKEFAHLFTDQKLEFVLYDQKQEFILQKKDGPYVWQYPFFSIADTFRRFMFYIAAIESNKNSVIVFEEPEVHSFPPYTQELAHRMIYSEENQFFVSTHSPYLLQTLVSNLADDQINVFVTYYEDYQTKVKALTAEELSFVQEYSTDIFFNLDRFVPNASPASAA